MLSGIMEDSQVTLRGEEGLISVSGKESRRSGSGCTALMSCILSYAMYSTCTPNLSLPLTQRLAPTSPLVPEPRLSHQRTSSVRCRVLFCSLDTARRQLIGRRRLADSAKARPRHGGRSCESSSRAGGGVLRRPPCVCVLIQAWNVCGMQ